MRIIRNVLGEQTDNAARLKQLAFTARENQRVYT